MVGKKGSALCGGKRGIMDGENVEGYGWEKGKKAGLWLGKERVMGGKKGRVKAGKKGEELRIGKSGGGGGRVKVGKGWEIRLWWE